MRAAVCHSFGTPLVIEEVELAAPGAEEVEVRVVACALCHSDIHFAEGAWGGSLPAVYGHEAAGVVEAVGAGVEHVRAGDHVVVSLIRSCGTCPACLRGEEVFCETTLAPAPDSVLQAADGSPINHGLGTAAFAERVVVHHSQVVAVPAELPFVTASLLGCGVLTGVGAVLNTASVEPGSSVVVIGTGGVGLNTVQGAVLAGASPIVAVDLSEDKLAAARGFGATHTVNGATADLLGAVTIAAGGRRPDYVFVTVGAASAIDQALTLARRGGTVVLVGMPASGVTVALDPCTVAADGLHIVGSKMGSAQNARDIPHLAALYREGRLKLDELISGHYPLEEINEAIESVKRGEALRNVIVLEQDAP